MSQHVVSATEPDPVMVDGGQVWLRRDIGKDVIERAEGDDVRTYDVWEAEEAVIFDASITEAYAREHFDDLWDWAQAQEMSPREYAESLSAANADAIADLSESVSDNAQAGGDISDALADLSQVVSDMRSTAKEA